MADRGGGSGSQRSERTPGVATTTRKKVKYVHPPGFFVKRKGHAVGRGSILSTGIATRAGRPNRPGLFPLPPSEPHHDRTDPFLRLLHPARSARPVRVGCGRGRGRPPPHPGLRPGRPPAAGHLAPPPGGRDRTAPRLRPAHRHRGERGAGGGHSAQLGRGRVHRPCSRARGAHPDRHLGTADPGRGRGGQPHRCRRHHPGRFLAPEGRPGPGLPPGNDPARELPGPGRRQAAQRHAGRRPSAARGRTGGGRAAPALCRRAVHGAVPPGRADADRDMVLCRGRRACGRLPGQRGGRAGAVHPADRPLPGGALGHGRKPAAHGLRLPRLHPARPGGGASALHQGHGPGPRGGARLVRHRGPGGPGRRRLGRGADRLPGRPWHGRGFRHRPGPSQGAAHPHRGLRAR